MKKTSGKPFEKLAESIFNNLKKFDNEYSVEQNVYLNSPHGKRQFDVLIKHETAGFEYYTAIECKDHKAKISIKEIDNFESKLRDVNIQKGILISRNGFSSKAISKAKRTNISLCTAHEALSKNWKIDIEINVFINVVSPKKFSPLFTHIVVDKEDSISTEQLIINNKDIKELLKKLWQKNELHIDFSKKIQTIKIPYIKPPYWLNVRNKTHGILKREITDFKIEVELQTDFYTIPLNELINTQVLKNITEEKITICIDIEQFIKENKSFKKISLTEFKNKRGLTLNVLKKYNDLTYGNSKASIKVTKNKL